MLTATKGQLVIGSITNKGYSRRDIMKFTCIMAASIGLVNSTIATELNVPET